jgi:hypothetical protein
LADDAGVNNESPRQLGLLDWAAEGPPPLRNPERWPPPSRFPFNHMGFRVAAQVDEDLRGSRAPLVITGFAALDRIVDFFARLPVDFTGPARFVLGSEPFASRRRAHPLDGHEVEQEITDYWLERGISILLSGKVLRAIEHIEAGRVAVRCARAGGRRIHAKVYVGDEAATVGSSNLTAAGMGGQVEANARFERRGDDAARYAELVQLAENIWELAVPYDPALVALLRQLLCVVRWQEALARACAELLEGEWARRYVESVALSGDTALWPSQIAGIAQAVWMIENVGSVLCADATGSGKTRLGAGLVRAVVRRIWSTGRMRSDLPVLICPPETVREAWQREFVACGQPMQPYSHGVLSRQETRGHEEVVQAVRRAQVLAVDEAHNFLNNTSHRTRRLLGNMADHVVLFTATPINRGPQDLLAIIDLLGADNLDPRGMKVFERIWRRRRGAREIFSPGEREELQRELQRFTLRRTKAELNQRIDAEPDRYRDRFGRPCRYPEHVPRVYACEEPERDRALAREVRALAEGLRGLVNLRAALELPAHWREEGIDDARYLDWRLKGAAGLARHHVMATLRSSRAALVEHIQGTQAACVAFDLSESFKDTATGNVVASLATAAGHPPESTLAAPLPEWLGDPRAHAQACDEERATYERIAALAGQISDARERAKVLHLAGILDRHALVVAFDSRLITLSVLQRGLHARGVAQALIATGASAMGRRRINKLFAPGSAARGVVALCSDSMAEGVNLQAAAAMVHLDMPSVVRIAEQRVGRVDRMDSPHVRIEAWWPHDAPEFALRTDELFIERHQLVAEVLGANIRLPEHLVKSRAPGGLVTPESMVEGLREAEREGVVSDGLKDAFEPVRALVQGARALVDGRTWAALRESRARVVSCVSLVTARAPFAFFAVASAQGGAPRWVLLTRPDAGPLTDLTDIERALRQRLTGDTRDRPLDAASQRGAHRVRWPPRRGRAHVPDDFAFQLTAEEWRSLRASPQIRAARARPHPCGRFAAPNDEHTGQYVRSEGSRRCGAGRDATASPNLWGSS